MIKLPFVGEETMKILTSDTLDKLLQRVNTNIEASHEVHAIANELIREFHVQCGFGLAGFLQVDSHYDNFAAVRAWVAKNFMKLDTGNADENFLLFKDKFVDCLPNVA